MAIIEEIQQMRASGAADPEIIKTLQDKGISVQQAYEALSQATIKDAVTQEPSEQNNPIQSSSMRPSVMESQDQTLEPQMSEYQQPEQYPPQYAEQSNQEYPAYSSQFSSDTISEIADQVLAEKMAPLKEGIERITDFKTSAEAKITILDERLQRIEKIIDRLQISILQRVGESITNIDDLKKELIETQKTFRAVTSQPQNVVTLNKEE